MRLANKAVTIIGAATGIGRETALLFGSEGARLLLADVNEVDGEGVAKSIRASGGGAVFVRTDLRVESEIAALFARSEEEFESLDAIVNVAGIQRAGPVHSADVRDWEESMTVNAKGSFLVAKYGAPHLRSKNGGAIVNMASLAALRGARGMGAYSASKGAVVSLTRVLAQELGCHQIRVNAVCPGWIDTSFNAPAIEMLGGERARDEMIESTVALRRQGTPKEVAEVLLFLASDSSSYITGQALVVDGGLG